jgi:hypothetical protein
MLVACAEGEALKTVAPIQRAAPKAEVLWGRTQFREREATSEILEMLKFVASCGLYGCPVHSYAVRVKKE